MRTEQVTSFQNPKVKNLLQLQEKSSVRREQGLFVVEGRRELEHCIEAGYKVRTVFYCPEIAGTEAGNDVGASFSGLSRESLVIEVPAALYRKIAYREGTEGIIAEVEAKHLSLNDLDLPENPLIVVLESVEKPGNLGAVLRSADAAGASAVIVCDPLTDLYNPNLIRASEGGHLKGMSDILKERGIAILTAQLQDSSLYYDTDMRRGVAIVMGTESTGLTPVWRQAADAHIRIPMLGRLDSLNVSVSAAILLFEAVRQRQI